jgi:FG-GAP-like repeat/FG-GAP repeat
VRKIQVLPLILVLPIPLPEIALALSFAPLLSHCSHATDLNRIRLPAEGGPGVVVVADLNGDRKLDIVVANERSGNASVYLGDGNRHFLPAPGSPVPAGPNPNDITIGDFNGDGRPDLAFANHETQELTVLLGNGRGDFAPAAYSPVNVTVKPHPHGIAAGDFDGDGSLDLVTDSWAEDRLEILFNPRKAGSPWTRTIYVAVGKHPYQRIRVADLNRDGHVDIVSPNLDGDNVTVLLGDGKGTFRQPAGSPFPCGDSPFNVSVGDLNADGIPDLAIVNSPSSTSDRSGRDGLTLLLGSGTGAFRVVRGSRFATDGFPNMVAIGDLDGDGVGDVVLSLPESDRVTAFYMSRSGTLAARKDTGVEGHPKGLAIGDFDGDGKGDIVIANNSANTITIIFGQ